VVGAGDTGAYVAMRLYRAGLAVVVIDLQEEALRPLGQAGCSTVVGDARTAAALATARPEISEVAVIAVSDADDIYRIAQTLRSAARDLRIVTWRTKADQRLVELEVDVYLRARATAVALAGAVLRPGLYQALGSEDFAGLEEVTVRNARATGIALRDLGLPGGARVILILRGGELVIPEADTPLMLLDHVTLGGEDEAVAGAFQLLSGRRLERVEGAVVPPPVLMPHPSSPDVATPPVPRSEAAALDDALEAADR